MPRGEYQSSYRRRDHGCSGHSSTSSSRSGMSGRPSGGQQTDPAKWRWNCLPGLQPSTRRELRCLGVTIKPKRMMKEGRKVPLVAIFLIHDRVRYDSGAKGVLLTKLAASLSTEGFNVANWGQMMRAQDTKGWQVILFGCNAGTGKNTRRLRPGWSLGSRLGWRGLPSSRPALDPYPYSDLLAQSAPPSAWDPSRAAAYLGTTTQEAGATRWRYGSDQTRRAVMLRAKLTDMKLLIGRPEPGLDVISNRKWENVEFLFRSVVALIMETTEFETL
ncbi:hypothetical protein FHL15_000525 [Xylaria flabelliformis]|uniref:Uncharacterized protein n=1 Tax=Xylaria flabelliformis TaxID=2512241 RepID=A0A553IE27_9PEZI|nr:hypothetical protein FHL15_000525 [Xylaria flabelliformis]